MKTDPPNGVNGAGGLQNHVTVGGQSGSLKMSRDTPCRTDHVVTWVPESVLDDEFRDMAVADFFVMQRKDRIAMGIHRYSEYQTRQSQAGLQWTQTGRPRTAGPEAEPSPPHSLSLWRAEVS
ncbi:unnamed protein product [Arctogadus glacialis]